MLLPPYCALRCHGYAFFFAAFSVMRQSVDAFKSTPLRQCYYAEEPDMALMLISPRPGKNTAADACLRLILRRRAHFLRQR